MLTDRKESQIISLSKERITKADHLIEQTGIMVYLLDHPDRSGTRCQCGDIAKK
jgi:hypothetical protein